GRAIPRCGLLSLQLFVLARRRGRPRRRAAAHRIRPRPPSAPRAGPLTLAGIVARRPHAGRRGHRASRARRRALIGEAPLPPLAGWLSSPLPVFNMRVCRIAIVQAGWHTPYSVPKPRYSKSMRPAIRKVLLGILILFPLPLAVHAALYASKDRPASFRAAHWSTVAILPPPHPDPHPP